MATQPDTIYLDHAATTPVDAEVVKAMLPYFSESFGNPSSVYQLGQEARATVEQARRDIASVLRCRPGEIIFLGGATESVNLALNGVAWAARLRNPGGPPPHIVTTVIEHSAVLESARWLERQGFALTLVPVGSDGLIDPAAIEAAIRPETCIVSVMYANNEIGTIQDILAIAEICQRHGVPLHTDATQATGSLPLDVNALGVDLLSLSAHKFYGPKGVGLLFVRPDIPIEWMQRGGGQEEGRRGGTENVPLIVGMATALLRAEDFRPAYASYCRNLRDRLLEGLQEHLPDLIVNGTMDPDRRLPNNLNVTFPGVQGETVLLALDMEGVAASAGSACSAGKHEPSHVLEALGCTPEMTRASVRFTVGRTNTPHQIEDAIDIIAAVVERVRAIRPTAEAVPS